jgi:hypothetical protein
VSLAESARAILRAHHTPPETSALLPCYPHDAPHPLQQGRPKHKDDGQIRGPSSTTSGGPHFCALTPCGPETLTGTAERQLHFAVGTTHGSKARQQMYLWEKFNGDVPGVIFWPIMFVMLGVLIPIVMAIR